MRALVLTGLKFMTSYIRSTASFIFYFFYFFILFIFSLFQCWVFWEWCPFPCFLVLLGFSPALSFIQQKYLLVPTVMAGQHYLLCHLYKALLYVYDFALVEIGVWWTMSVRFFFFFHPTRPKYRGIKMKKKKKKKALYQLAFHCFNLSFMLHIVL